MSRNPPQTPDPTQEPNKPIFQFESPGSKRQTKILTDVPSIPRSAEKKKKIPQGITTTASIPPSSTHLLSLSQEKSRSAAKEKSPPSKKEEQYPVPSKRNGSKRNKFCANGKCHNLKDPANRYDIYKDYCAVGFLVIEGMYTGDQSS